MDRRLQRTRALLQEALTAMIREKGYEATTVQDIIDRANVGRSTFYAHFADKETLLVSSLADLRTELRRHQAQSLEASGRTPDGGFGFSLAMLEHAQDHWDLYQAMIGRKSGAVVMQHLTVMLGDLVREGLAAMGLKTTTTRRDLIVHYVTGAFMSVLTWWLDRATELAPREVDEIFRRLVLHGLVAEFDLTLEAEGTA